jgi:hypothetical protein
MKLFFTALIVITTVIVGSSAATVSAEPAPININIDTTAFGLSLD